MAPSPLVKTANSGKTSRTLYLDIARVAAIFLVCLNHAVNRSYDNYANQMAEFLTTPVISILFKTLCTVASHLGVPLFLMIFGVLIMKKPINSVKDIKHFYKHNLLGVFITAEIWYVLFYWYLLLGSPSHRHLLDEGILPAIWGMVKTMLFLDQVTFDGTWYMPMILCVYATIPFVVIAKDTIKRDKFSPIVLLPLLLLYLVIMVLPAINAGLSMHGLPKLALKIYEENLFPMFYIYIFAGYFVGQGCLSKLDSRSVGLIAVGLFGICCSIQYYAYSRPMNYLIGYSFPLLPFCAAFLFEFFRRIAPKLQKLAPTISYLSRIAFGIYFVHIVIITALTWFIGDWDMIRPLRLIVYQIVSFAGSIAVIAPLTKIPLLRKYLFMYK